MLLVLPFSLHIPYETECMAAGLARPDFSAFRNFFVSVHSNDVKQLDLSYVDHELFILLSHQSTLQFNTENALKPFSLAFKICPSLDVVSEHPGERTQRLACCKAARFGCHLISIVSWPK